MAQNDKLSMRFKHGVHTIFLPVDPLSSVSAIQEDLLEVLVERYPEGLKSSLAPPKTTPLPTDAGLIAFASPKTPIDLAQGWKPLQAGGSDTLVSMGIKDNSTLAFDLLSDAGDKPVFHIEFPTYEEMEPEGDAE